MLKYSLGAADAHWISLKPEFEGVALPSKFYGVAAAGRPVIAITAENGELAHLVRHYDCGFVVAPGNAETLASVLLRLSSDRQCLAAMGQRARAMLEARFARKLALERWCHLLAEVEQAAVPAFNFMRGERAGTKEMVFRQPGRV